MFINSEISKYISKNFFLCSLLTISSLGSVIFIGDLVEYSKKLSSYNETGISLLFLLAFLNLPKMLLEILPFAMLFAGMLWTIRINNYRELLIIRASGIPLVKVCIPIILVSFLLGIFFVFTFSPVISATQKKIQTIEAEKLGKPITSLLVSNSGFWLKQGSSKSSEIIYAKRLNIQNMTLMDVLVYKFNKNYEVKERLKAKTSELKDSYWLLNDIKLTNVNGVTITKEYLRLETSITNSQIKEGLSSPETISVWNLYSFIVMFEKAGFSAKKHKLYFNKLLCLPLFLSGMSLLGISLNMVTFSKRTSSVRNFLGVIFGFLIFYMTKIIGAIAISGKLTFFLSALIPSFIPLLFGAILIFIADEKLHQ